MRTWPEYERLRREANHYVFWRSLNCSMIVHKHVQRRERNAMSVCIVLKLGKWQMTQMWCNLRVQFSWKIFIYLAHFHTIYGRMQIFCSYFYKPISEWRFHAYMFIMFFTDTFFALHIEMRARGQIRFSLVQISNHTPEKAVIRNYVYMLSIADLHMGCHMLTLPQVHTDLSILIFAWKHIWKFKFMICCYNNT